MHAPAPAPAPAHAHAHRRAPSHERGVCTRSGKVIEIKCSTRDAMQKAYQPYNQALYKSLHADQSSGAAPAYARFGRLLTRARSEHTQPRPYGPPTPICVLHCSTAPRSRRVGSAHRVHCSHCWVSPRVSAHMHRYEAPFAKFNLEESVKCGTHERTMGGLSTSELLAHFQ